MPESTRIGIPEPPVDGVRDRRLGEMFRLARKSPSLCFLIRGTAYSRDRFSLKPPHNGFGYRGYYPTAVVVDDLTPIRSCPASR